MLHPNTVRMKGQTLFKLSKIHLPISIHFQETKICFPYQEIINVLQKWTSFHFKFR